MKRILIFAALLPAPAIASNITTAEMGDTAAYLVTEATCGEVENVIKTLGMNSDHDAMLMLALITFTDGYAVGKGISQQDAMTELLTECYGNPDKLFSDISD